MNSTEVRARLDIPANAFVIGHVGRFHDQKNHRFLVQIAAEIIQRRPDMRVLLVGDGPLRPLIKRQVKEAGLADKVIFTGVRPDVPRLMLGAMDVFLFPSLFEGLPLTLIECQAAALPCVFSENITDEIVIVGPLMHALSLSQPALQWAEAVLAAHKDKAITQPQAPALLKRSPFNILTSVQRLQDIYSGI